MMSRIESCYAPHLDTQTRIHRIPLAILYVCAISVMLVNFHVQYMYMYMLPSETFYSRLHVCSYNLLWAAIFSTFIALYVR